MARISRAIAEKWLKPASHCWNFAGDQPQTIIQNGGVKWDKDSC